MVSVAAVFAFCSNWRATRQCKFDLVWLLPILMGRSKRLQRDGLTARALKHVCQLAATQNEENCPATKFTWCTFKQHTLLT